MKRLLLIFLLLLAVAPTHAQPLSGEQVVRILITAAHKDQLQNFLTTTDLTRIAAHPRHGLSPEALFLLLKTIPMEDLTMETKSGEQGVVVRTTGKVRLDFHLENRQPARGDALREGMPVVVAVTP
jgi:hypothetical protein